MSKLIPTHHTGSPGLMSTIDLQSPMSLGPTKAGKEDPSPSCMEGGGIWLLSAKPPKLYTSSYRLNGWRTTV